MPGMQAGQQSGLPKQAEDAGRPVRDLRPEDRREISPLSQVPAAESRSEKADAAPSQKGHEMTKHITRNTVETPAWCNRCKRETPHRGDGVKQGPCLVCTGVKLEKLDLKINSVEWPRACECDRWPFPHFHEDFLRKWDMEHR